MSQPTSRGGHASGMPSSNERYDSIAEAIPPPEQVRGAHDTYDKGEVSSLGALVADISADISTLMRQEVDLAKAELRQSASRAGRGAGLLGGAGVATHLLLIFLSVALMFALGDPLDGLGWSALVVAGIWAIIAAILAVLGRQQISEVEGLPRTVETATKIPDALKGNEELR